MVGDFDLAGLHQSGSVRRNRLAVIRALVQPAAGTHTGCANAAYADPASYLYPHLDADTDADVHHDAYTHGGNSNCHAHADRYANVDPNTYLYADLDIHTDAVTNPNPYTDRHTDLYANANPSAYLDTDGHCSADLHADLFSQPAASCSAGPSGRANCACCS